MDSGSFIQGLGYKERRERQHEREREQGMGIRIEEFGKRDEDLSMRRAFLIYDPGEGFMVWHREQNLTRSQPVLSRITFV